MASLVDRAARAASKVLASVRLPQHAEAIDKFHHIYYHGTAGVPPRQSMTWMGVNILKCPMDLWVYQEILFETKPDVIVECGVRFGGAALWYAHMCDLMGHGRIVGCDITLKDVHEKTRSHPRVKLIEGSSTDPSIVKQVEAECRGERTMVVLDSDHSEAHVYKELLAYSPLVTRGCYLICEDTNVNGHPADPGHGPGPFEAVQRFVKEHPEWEIDKGCERHLMTFNPSGFLRHR